MVTAGHRSRDDIVVSLSLGLSLALTVSHGVCFPHLPEETVPSSSTPLWDSGDAFQARDSGAGLHSGWPGIRPAQGRRSRQEEGERACCGREGKQVSGSLPPGYGSREEPWATHPRPSVPTEQLAGTLKLDQTRSLLPSPLD